MRKHKYEAIEAFADSFSRLDDDERERLERKVKMMKDLNEILENKEKISLENKKFISQLIFWGITAIMAGISLGVAIATFLLKSNTAG